MSVQLLDKTRKINKLLHNNHSTKVVFNDICEVLMETLSSNILVISKKGKVLGISLCPGVEEITELIEDKVGGYVDAALNERLLGVLSTKENVNLQTLGFERKAFTMTDLVMPTRSAILLATRMPSSPFSSSKIWMMASSSEKDSVLNADLTT